MVDYGYSEFYLGRAYKILSKWVIVREIITAVTSLRTTVCQQSRNEHSKRVAGLTLLNFSAKMLRL